MLGFNNNDGSGVDRRLCGPAKRGDAACGWSHHISNLLMLASLRERHINEVPPDLMHACYGSLDTAWCAGFPAPILCSRFGRLFDLHIQGPRFVGGIADSHMLRSSAVSRSGRFRGHCGGRRKWLSHALQGAFPGLTLTGPNCPVQISEAELLVFSYLPFRLIPRF